MDSVLKHVYPTTPEDEVSNESNMKSLKEDWKKSPRSQDPLQLKALFI